MATDRRITKTKTNIMAAFQELILEKNFCDITVKEISSRANIERKTFYLHYTCIEDLVHEMYDKMATRLNNDLKLYLKENTFDIKDIFEEASKLILEKYDIFKTIAINDSYSFFRKGFEETLFQCILTIIEDVYHINTANRKYYVMFYASGIARLYLNWLKGDMNCTISELNHILSKASFSSVDSLLM